MNPENMEPQMLQPNNSTKEIREQEGLEKRLIEKLRQVKEILKKEREEQEERARAKQIDGLKGTIFEIREKNPKGILRDKNVVFLAGEGKEDEECLFIGDIHGDQASLEAILRETDFEQKLQKKEGYLVFLGDYLDRGDKQIETLEKILDLKIKYGERVILLKGNHEGETLLELTSLGRLFGFELSKRFPNKDNIISEISENLRLIYRQLPYVLATKNGVVALHGGIPELELESFRGLETFNFKGLSKDERFKLSEQILWNDPMTSNERNYNFIRNRRGKDFREFGYSPFEEFLEGIGAKVVIRGHQPVDGVQIHENFGSKLATIFSTGGKESGYKKTKNIGVCLINLSHQIEQWEESHFLKIPAPQESPQQTSQQLEEQKKMEQELKEEQEQIDLIALKEESEENQETGLQEVIEPGEPGGPEEGPPEPERLVQIQESGGNGGPEGPGGPEVSGSGVPEERPEQPRIRLPEKKGFWSDLLKESYSVFVDAIVAVLDTINFVIDVLYDYIIQPIGNVITDLVKWFKEDVWSKFKKAWDIWLKS